MRVPLLDLSEQYRKLSGEIRAATDEVLASQRFILGPKLAQFEEATAEYCGSPHAIGVSSGTDALLAVFMALEIGLGDAVITSAYSFFATSGCIARVGATPVFIDIDPDTYNISAPALRRYIEKYCRRVEGKLVNENRQTIVALVPVHLFGLCCDMNEMLAVAREHNLILIEDAAQAIGAEFPLENASAKAGTIGDAGCFSFYPSKNLGAAGDAGLVTCRNAQFAERLRICRQHGMEARYQHQFIGGNFRLDELQAAILKIKLPHLDSWSGARREAARFYTTEFQGRGLQQKIKLPVEPYAASSLVNHHIYHQYVIRSPNRDELRQRLTDREIETAIYYPLALHEQPCFEYLGYKAGDFPEAERAARESLALPIYPEISREAQRYVVNCIAEFFS
ncbi:MAG TPA: DegT/DnrJ/EryC1/StrS family aminotransferase [Chthoniobacterales bacterium]|jgi:dTDP-4-amino-4,6-dideoxygalactose transaminase|nr:DegT/DnrJ/EryC1/StrS family aminotransferase [Chthoniobacterales bacterium]